MTWLDDCMTKVLFATAWLPMEHHFYATWKVNEFAKRKLVKFNRCNAWASRKTYYVCNKTVPLSHFSVWDSIWLFYNIYGMFSGMDFHELLDIPQGDRRKYHDDVTVMVVSLEGRIWKSSGKYLWVQRSACGGAKSGQNWSIMVLNVISSLSFWNIRGIQHTCVSNFILWRMKIPKKVVWSVQCSSNGKAMFLAIGNFCSCKC